MGCYRLGNDLQATNLYPVIVNNSNPTPPDSQQNLVPGSIQDAQVMANEPRDSLVITTNVDHTLVLGSNSALNITVSSLPPDAKTPTIPTVPFGLNLGQRDVWNGSLILGDSILGASYDANRVATGCWALIPESRNGQGMILQAEKQELTKV